MWLTVKISSNQNIFVHTITMSLVRQAMFAEQTPEGAERIIATTQAAVEDGSADQSKAHTLREFSIDYLRPPPKRTLSRTLSRSAFKRKGEEIWNYTRVSGTHFSNHRSLVRLNIVCSKCIRTAIQQKIFYCALSLIHLTLCIATATRTQFNWTFPLCLEAWFTHNSHTASSNARSIHSTHTRKSVTCLM